MKLRDLAHARAGDKGDVSNISVIAYEPGDYAFLLEHVTAEAVRAHMADYGPRRGGALRTTRPRRAELRPAGRAGRRRHPVAGAGYARQVALVVTAGAGIAEPAMTTALLPRHARVGRVQRKVHRQHVDAGFADQPGQAPGGVGRHDRLDLVLRQMPRCGHPGDLARRVLRRDIRVQSAGRRGQHVARHRLGARLGDIGRHPVDQRLGSRPGIRTAGIAGVIGRRHGFRRVIRMVRILGHRRRRPALEILVLGEVLPE